MEIKNLEEEFCGIVNVIGEVDEEHAAKCMPQ